MVAVILGSKRLNKRVRTQVYLDLYPSQIACLPSKLKRSLISMAWVVARDRIELPTRGFSVPCSTD